MTIITELCNAKCQITKSFGPTKHGNKTVCTPCGISPLSTEPAGRRSPMSGRTAVPTQAYHGTTLPLLPVSRLTPPRRALAQHTSPGQPVKQAVDTVVPARLICIQSANASPINPSQSKILSNNLRLSAKMVKSAY